MSNGPVRQCLWPRRQTETYRVGQNASSPRCVLRLPLAGAAEAGCLWRWSIQQFAVIDREAGWKSLAFQGSRRDPARIAEIAVCNPYATFGDLAAFIAAEAVLKFEGGD